MCQHGHDIFYASGTNKKVDKVSLLQPKHETTASSKPTTDTSPESSGDLKIAWRYKDVKGSSDQEDQQQTSTADLSQSATLTQWSPTPGEELRSDPCFVVLMVLHFTNIVIIQ